MTFISRPRSLIDSWPRFSLNAKQDPQGVRVVVTANAYDGVRRDAACRLKPSFFLLKPRNYVVGTDASDDSGRRISPTWTILPLPFDRAQVYPYYFTPAGANPQPRGAQSSTGRRSTSTGVVTHSRFYFSGTCARGQFAGRVLVWLEAWYHWYLDWRANWGGPQVEG